MVTILHISDLHRDSDGILTTTSLIESLRRDRERYVEKGIPTPDIAIVSGDVIHGARGTGDSTQVELERQYNEAADFLQQLANLMFNGKRERIVLVPGNHDVSHDYVMQASAHVEIPDDPEKRRILAKSLSAENSLLRWIASDFSVRRIQDAEIYRRRMKPFADFYNKFYQGLHEFPLDEAEQIALFDYPELDIAVVGLSSCCENDLFNRSGRIHPACVAEATRLVAEPIRKGRIAIATWHHNLSGGPKDSDYVDPEFLQCLIDGGFSLGLHGHQHRAQYLEHRFTADSERGMAVVSAGTLCGGPRTLPPGRMRAYNLITLDKSNKKGILHVREMKNSAFGMPIWGEAYISEFGGSSVSFNVNLRSTKAFAENAASEAFELLRKGEFSAAFNLARSTSNDAFARRIAVEALSRLGDWAGIREFCDPPQSSLEIIALLSSLDELNDKRGISKIIQSDYVSNSQDVAVRQMVDQMRLRVGGYQ